MRASSAVSVVSQSDERRRVYVVGTGTIHADDVIEYLMDKQASGTWGYSTLLDVRNATTDVTPGQTRQILGRLQMIGRAAERGPIAIVTNSDLVFGLARMYAAHAEVLGMHYGVFREIAEAERWLDEQAEVRH